MSDVTHDPGPSSTATTIFRKLFETRVRLFEHTHPYTGGISSGEEEEACLE